MVADAARKYALPRSLVRAVARAESDFDAAAISPRGAQGVMQLMPGTARDLGVQNALDPAENIDAGARLLRRLLEVYEGRVAEALAAYNAGPGAVARHQGVPPYRETRGYIRKVVKEFEKAERKRPLSAGKKR
jgi:soluble lytic murein transglycosylase-like protein